MQSIEEMLVSKISSLGSDVRLIDVFLFFDDFFIENRGGVVIISVPFDVLSDDLETVNIECVDSAAFFDAKVKSIYCEDSVSGKRRTIAAYNV